MSPGSALTQESIGMDLFFFMTGKTGRGIGYFLVCYATGRLSEGLLGRERACKEETELAIFPESLTASSGRSMALGCVKVEGGEKKKYI